MQKETNFIIEQEKLQIISKKKASFILKCCLIITNIIIIASFVLLIASDFLGINVYLWGGSTILLSLFLFFFGKFSLWQSFGSECIKIEGGSICFTKSYGFFDVVKTVVLKDDIFPSYEFIKSTITASKSQLSFFRFTDKGLKEFIIKSSFEFEKKYVQPVRTHLDNFYIYQAINVN